MSWHELICTLLHLRRVFHALQALAAEPQTNGKSHHEHEHAAAKPAHFRTSWWTIAAYIVIFAISKYTLPRDLHPSQPTLSHVWYYGWVTAVSTGLGVVPLMFASELGEQVSCMLIEPFVSVF